MMIEIHVICDFSMEKDEMRWELLRIRVCSLNLFLFSLFSLFLLFYFFCCHSTMMILNFIFVWKSSKRRRMNKKSKKDSSSDLFQIFHASGNELYFWEWCRQFYLMMFQIGRVKCFIFLGIHLFFRMISSYGEDVVKEGGSNRWWTLNFPSTPF